MDTNKRTLIKSISYRTCVALAIFAAAILMNYSAGFGLTFVIISYTIGLASFFIHERLWNLVDWNRTEGYETKLRSVSKTVTWRIFSLIILFALGMILGLSSNEAIEWTVITNILFIVIHYIHERVWNKIEWGKNSFTLEENLA